MNARDVQCFLLMGARVFQQFMRNILAALIVYMPDEIASQRGVIISAVAAGYLITQVPGGMMADKLGAKNVVTIAMLGSSLACLAIPSAYAALGVDGVWWCLASMGFISGPLFPTSSVFLSKWIPADERSKASTYLDIGISIGALASVPAGGYLGLTIGWGQTYMLVGALGVGFVALWMYLAAETPDACFYISKEEKDHLARVVVAKKADKKDDDAPKQDVAPLWRVVTHPAVIAVFVAHMAFNYGAYFLTNWSPTYYKEVLGMDTAAAGLHLSMPHVSNLAGKLMNNPISAQLNKAGFSRLGSRRFFTGASFVGAGLVMLAVQQARDLPVVATTALLTTANFMWGLSPSGFKANYLDVTVTYTGAVSGIGNTLGTVSSYVGPQIVSYILKEYESWDLIFVSIFVANVLAATFFGVFSSVTPVELRKKDA
eukprot:TRINITY_DN991_c0_g1_i4.p1 TRINITY_DN991_c0_g1~~TRINITY_DN991_c0_g1_i4.p1  ORF type:complete len:430 (+),score=141.71 TRINITY_DN991_c0_g1_i4:232-1521(+)